MDDLVPVPRTAIRFPIELQVPPLFRPDRPSTWPHLEGRLEYLEGRLLYMPPCGDVQQGVAVAVIAEIFQWARSHREFFVGGNEAGMKLGDDVRGAEAAIWRRTSIEPLEGHFPRSAPILAVEVAGRDEGEKELRDKARWYLEHGVEVVWLVLPETREVVVVGSAAESRHAKGDRLPPHPSLPGLSPAVEEFFVQLDTGS